MNAQSDDIRASLQQQLETDQLLGEEKVSEKNADPIVHPPREIPCFAAIGVNILDYSFSP